MKKIPSSLIILPSELITPVPRIQEATKMKCVIKNGSKPQIKITSPYFSLAYGVSLKSSPTAHGRELASLKPRRRVHVHFLLADSG